MKFAAGCMQPATIFIVAIMCNNATMAGMKDSDMYRAKARIMKALANPDRLMIVEHLGKDECCICELQPLFKKNKSTLSRHVAALRNAGIITERRDGVRIYLTLATPCVLSVFDCLMGVLKKEARRTSRLVRSGAKP